MVPSSIVLPLMKGMWWNLPSCSEWRGHSGMRSRSRLGDASELQVDVVVSTYCTLCHFSQVPCRDRQYVQYVRGSVFHTAGWGDNVASTHLGPYERVMLSCAERIVSAGTRLRHSKAFSPSTPPEPPGGRQPVSSRK